MADGPFPTFRVALERTALPRGGQTPPLRAKVAMDVYSTLLGTVAVEFRIDSGAGITVMSVEGAEQAGVPIAQSPISMDTLTQRGNIQARSFYSGAVFATFPQVPTRTFCFGCYFDPAQLEEVPPVLGLGGDVLKHLRLTFDGSPSVEMPFGFAMIEVVSPDPALTSTSA